jgi:hypothetical protein
MCVPAGHRSFGASAQAALNGPAAGSGEIEMSPFRSRDPRKQTGEGVAPIATASVGDCCSLDSEMPVVLPLER